MQKRLIEHFVSNSKARFAAELTGINLKNAAYYYQRLRKVIAHQREQESY